MFRASNHLAMSAFVPPISASFTTSSSRRISLYNCPRHLNSTTATTPQLLRRRRPHPVPFTPQSCEQQPQDQFTSQNDQEPTPTLESIKQLLSSDKKADQQKALLHIRFLPCVEALDLLLFSVRNTKNDFIRATATVAIGELDLNENPSVRDTAVATLAELLATAEDYSVRSAAAAGMGYATRIDATTRTTMVEALSRALLEDGEWQVQFSCLASLGALADKRAVSTVLPWLQNNNDLIVQAAVGALGDLADVEALPALLGLLGANDMMTRQRLAQALGNIPACVSEPAAIDALRTLARDQSFVVREAATEALKSFGVPEKSATKNGDGLSDDEMLDLEVTNLLQGDEAGNATESASDALRRRLERSFSTEWAAGHPSLSAGTNAADATAAYRRQRQVNDGIASSVSSGKSTEDGKEDETPEEETELISDKNEWQRVVDTMKHGEEKDQVLAAIELRKFDRGLARDAVREASGTDPDRSSQRLRSVCIGLLGRAGDVDGLVLALQNDPEQNVRSACCDALVDAGGGDVAVDACIKCLQTDEHWLVRISAAIALGTIGKNMVRVERALIDCVRNGAPELELVQQSVVRRHAVTALGFLGAVNAVAAFMELLGKPGGDQAVRYRIAAALSGIESEESVQLARQLARDSDEFVAEMAQSSLDSLAKRGFP